MAVDAALWRAGWTQSRLAQAAGIDQTTVSRKLAGRRPFLGRELVQIATLFGVDAAEFLAPNSENPHPAGPNGGNGNAERSTTNDYSSQDTSRVVIPFPQVTGPTSAPARRAA